MSTPDQNSNAPVQAANDPATPSAEQLENRAAIENPDVIDIPLENGFKYGGKQVTSVQVRKPGGKALSGIKLADLLQGDVDSIHKVLPRVTTPTLTSSIINDLEPCDIAQLGGALILFLQPKSVRVQALQEQ